MAVIIPANTCYDAWVNVCNHLINHPRNHDTNLFIEIETPCNFTDLSSWLKHYNPDKFVPDAGKVRHVVNTIFPFGLKSFYGDRKDFYSKYSSIFNKSTNKSWGTYFQRLIAFGKGCIEGSDRPNQLENAIKALLGKSTQKNFITFHLTASNIESNVRPLGSPCWQYGELIVNEKDQIDLIAVYRNHDYHNKALGNFIGLAKLLDFICAESGHQTGRLLIHSIHAYSSQPISKLTRLLNS